MTTLSVRVFRALAIVALLIAPSLALLVAPSLARAHGGLPIAEQILVRDGQLYVPTRYWGLFYGADGGPWRWICEEAVNKRQDRRWALGGSGALHATDYTGVTSSRDGGCTWIGAGGELGRRPASQVFADPLSPRRVFATTDAGPDLPWNGLFRSDDDGQSWTAIYQVDWYLRGGAISADAKVLYVVGVPRAGGMPRLAVSKDGGQSFVDQPIDFAIDGFASTQIEPLAVDPRDPSTLYLRVASDPTRVLLRATAFGAKLAELLRVDAEIGAPAFDGTTLYLPTRAGLYRALAGAAPQRISTLTRTQCLRFVGKVLYACAWNYAPDEMAVGRSDDGGEHFSKVFQYHETREPIMSCGAETPAAKLCPGLWRMYADQLGIDLAPDGGGKSDGGTVTPPLPKGCQCGVDQRTQATAPLGALALLIAATFFRVRRPRRSASRVGRADAP